jgi:hypothetical protein
MPYIPQSDRDRFERVLNEVAAKTPRTAGELNYLLTEIAHMYIESKGENYQHYNDVIGALEGCKLELYRRRVGQYEDVKIAQNGDV